MEKTVKLIKKILTLLGLHLLIASCGQTTKDDADTIRTEHLIAIGFDAMSPNGIINATRQFWTTS